VSRRPHLLLLSVGAEQKEKGEDVVPTDDVFIRLLKTYEYIQHFELSVPDRIIGTRRNTNGQG
jgi:hypothetical protein